MGYPVQTHVVPEYDLKRKYLDAAQSQIIEQFELREVKQNRDEKKMPGKLK